MLWLEMSRDVDHGGGDWGFTKSLWSPKFKNSEGKESTERWAFWDLLLNVKAGDQVLHLRGKGEHAKFVGFSIAASDGFETIQRPPNAGSWSYATSFHRVLLDSYVSFPEHISLINLFKISDIEMRTYFEKNKAIKGSNKRRLFYVVQGGQLQCLNGAYLSEVDDDLAEIILNTTVDRTQNIEVMKLRVSTNEVIRSLKTRVGQGKFSQAVRLNYKSKCCFPGCEVNNPEFLVGAHIARWSDDSGLRGEVSNGLCLCLTHDRAFEKGIFCIDQDFKIMINRDKSIGWIGQILNPFSGRSLSTGVVLPSKEALEIHRTRFNM
jgi:putative restriction endonuclease